MGIIDYSKEPQSDIAFIDMKSFYASVECVDLGRHPLTTSLCVMSRADNVNGLILASSPTFKKVFGKENVGRSYDLPFDIHTKKFSYSNAKRQGIEILDIPLTFITDDILHVITSNQRSYFRLNQQKAKDKRDHYFLFEVKMVENTRSYKYIGHQYALKA